MTNRIEATTLFDIKSCNTFSEYDIVDLLEDLDLDARQQEVFTKFLKDIDQVFDGASLDDLEEMQEKLVETREDYDALVDENHSLDNVNDNLEKYSDELLVQKYKAEQRIEELENQVSQLKK